MQLSNLEKLTHKRKRVGRGGDRGGSSGRGHDGQKCRPGAGSEIRSNFEGGQMPLSRRLPCRGFTNVFKKEHELINLDTLEKHFSAGDTVNSDTLKTKGIIRGARAIMVKILGNGALTKNLIIHADAFSQTAIAAIEKAGGKALLIKES